MSAPIPRTYWMNFSTGEKFRPPSPDRIAPKYARIAPNCADERIPFPYCYQRLILDEEEFQECKAEFIKIVNDKRFHHIFQSRTGKR